MMPIDYEIYPKNWLSEIRPRILNRSNYMCEFCGLEHNSYVYRIKIYAKSHRNYFWRSLWFRSKEDAVREDLNKNLKKVKVILTIAHLDHDASNKDVKDERLKALCQMCHLRYDAKHKYFKKTRNEN